MRGRFLYCVWGVVADNEYMVGGSCTVNSMTDESVIYFSWDIMVGLVVGMYVFISDLCSGCL